MLDLESQRRQKHRQVAGKRMGDLKYVTITKMMYIKKISFEKKNGVKCFHAADIQYFPSKKSGSTTYFALGLRNANTFFWSGVWYTYLKRV